MNSFSEIADGRYYFFIHDGEPYIGSVWSEYQKEYTENGIEEWIEHDIDAIELKSRSTIDLDFDDPIQIIRKVKYDYVIIDAIKEELREEYPEYFV